jgi:hypothetical protein
MPVGTMCKRANPEASDSGFLLSHKQKVGFGGGSGVAAFVKPFLMPGAQFSVDVLYRGGKPQRGRRIVLKIDHIITTENLGLGSGN